MRNVRVTGAGGGRGTPEGPGASGWIEIEWEDDMDREIKLLDVNGHLVRVLVTTALLAVGETLSSESSLRVPCGSADANYPKWVEARIVEE